MSNDKKIKKIKWLLRLYPRVWRNRYETEFVALLEQQSLGWFIFWDVVWGAVDAHLNSESIAWGIKPMLNTLRKTALTVFCACIAFGIAGMALYSLMDDSPFVPDMKVQPLLKLCWQSVIGGSTIMLGAVVIGSLPIAWGIFKQIFAAKRRDLLWLLSIPPLALLFLIFVWGGTVLLVFSSGAQTIPRNISGLVTAIWIATFILASIVSTWAICRVVVRSEIETQTFALRKIHLTVQPYIFAFLPATIATGAMLLMTLGTLGFSIVAAITTPQDFNANNGLWNAPTIYSMLGIGGIMTIATLLAAFSVVHSWRVRRAYQKI